MTTNEKIQRVVLTIGGILVAFVLSIFIIRCGSSSIEDYNDKVYQNGVQAAEVGIPPDANPYIHNFKHANVWLKGYIEQLKKQRDNYKFPEPA